MTASIWLIDAAGKNVAEMFRIYKAQRTLLYKLSELRCFRCL